MRYWVWVIILLLPAWVRAQSVADDIQQLLLDVQKLAQMKQILSAMYSEYTMLQQGYEQIKGLSQGTFSLHKAFLDGLLLVSPAVSSYPKVTDIISKEASLIGSYNASSGYFRGSGVFTSQELGGFSTNYGSLLQRGQKDVDELTMVITDGELRMSDAERLTAIDRIDADMTRQLTLLHSFNNMAALQAAQRARAAREVGTVRGLYGITP